LDASGGGVFRNLLGAAEDALIRAAASTPPLGAFLMFRQYLIACAVVFVVFPLSTLAQDRNIYDACAIPREWQPALTERLKSLTEYQRAGEWQRVSDMFGPFF
jgi:hypothetical protein